MQCVGLNKNHGKSIERMTWWHKKSGNTVHSPQYDSNVFCWVKNQGAEQHVGNVTVCVTKGEISQFINSSHVHIVMSKICLGGYPNNSK